MCLRKLLEIDSYYDFTLFSDICIVFMTGVLHVASDLAVTGVF